MPIWLQSLLWLLLVGASFGLGYIQGKYKGYWQGRADESADREALATYASMPVPHIIKR